MKRSRRAPSRGVKRRDGLTWNSGATRAPVPERGPAQWNSASPSRVRVRSLPGQLHVPVLDEAAAARAAEHLQPGEMFFFSCPAWLDDRHPDPFPVVKPIRGGDSELQYYPASSYTVFTRGTVAVYFGTVRRDERCEAADAAIKDMYGSPEGAAVRRTYPVFLVGGARYLFPWLDCLVHSSDPAAEQLLVSA